MHISRFAHVDTDRGATSEGAVRGALAFAVVLLLRTMVPPDQLSLVAANIHDSQRGAAVTFSVDEHRLLFEQADGTWPGDSRATSLVIWTLEMRTVTQSSPQ